MKESLPKPVPYGNYLLLDRVNVGGMAEVFRAKSSNLEGIERLVAIKRILPHLARDPDFSSMFIDEARIAINLRHANIAQMYELSRVGESLYIAMEYVHGRDLRALINRMRYLRRDLPIPMVAYIISKVCEGLDYAHRKRDDLTMCAMNIVHRDVSPQNVILSYEGEIKIIDFGIAKAASKRSHTEAGILKGKFGYMAPEQVAGGDIDRRADVFCTGILMYELLTTDRLFAGSSELSTLRRIRNVEVAPPSMLNRNIPDELEEIVLKALAARPEDRYEYASELSDDLQRFLQATQAEVFGSRQLSAFMHDIFEKDLQEDQNTLEALLRAQPKELPAPSRESHVWKEASPSAELNHASAAVLQSGDSRWGASNESFPDTPPTHAAQHDVRAAHVSGPLLEDELLSSGDYAFSDDEATRSLASHPEPYESSAQVPIASPPSAMYAQSALHSQAPVMHTTEAQASHGQNLHPLSLEPIPGQGQHVPQHTYSPSGAYPQGKKPVKTGRAILWIVLWFLLGGLFLGMVYLLFFVPAPKRYKRTGQHQASTRKNPTAKRKVPSVLPMPSKRTVGSSAVPSRTRVTPPRTRVVTRTSVKATDSKRKVLIRSKPSRSLLYLDGRLYGRTPTTLTFRVGTSHKIVIRRTGYRSVSRRISVQKAGQTLNVFMRLSSKRKTTRRSNSGRTARRRTKPTARRKSKGFGYLSVKGLPVARIYINGFDTGRYVLVRRKMPAGKYKIHFVTSEGDVWETHVTIKAGQALNRVSRYKKK